MAHEDVSTDPGLEVKSAHVAMIIFGRDGIADGLGLPQGTKVMNLVYLPDKDAFCLVIEHPDLPEVFDGGALQQIVPVYRHADVTDLIDVIGQPPKKKPIVFVSWAASGVR